MPQIYFKINFLQPGKNLAPEKGLRVILYKLQSFQLVFARQLYRKVSTSVSLLVICFIVLSLGSFIFYSRVYLPREQTLKTNAKEIKELHAKVSTLRVKIKKQQELKKATKARFDQLRDLKKVRISWLDKLQGLKRAITRKIWLNSLQVQDKKIPITVTIQGSTFTDVDRHKPLKIISEFANNLISDPAWNKTFDLKDWNITGKSEDTDKILNFELILQRK